MAEQKKRYVIYPIQYPSIWQFYKKAVSCFWTTEEIDLTKDKADWVKLTEDEQHFIKNTLAFFAASDGIVNENLANRFINEVDIAEAKFFYGFQIAMENCHSDTYSLLIDTYIQDREEKDRLFNAIEHIPIINKKAQWCFKWIRLGLTEQTSLSVRHGLTEQTSLSVSCPTTDFIYRLVAFACVEGIFFSSSFCSIYWLKKRGLMPGLTFSNELISRDESLHTEFAVHLYHILKTNTVEKEKILEMVKEAVEIEKEFSRESLRANLIGMNSKLMGEYIEFVGDRLLVQLGLEKYWNTKNPFDFMELISMNSKTNFFESRVSQYSKAAVSSGMTTNKSVGNFVIMDDF